ncbi:MAG TPA: hypothetical protein VEW47_10025 [Candidatus Dormibacteraeota bacterium]|nr:hypothetical protein [Candidatus Dormibacteraeota bacterium]
MAPTIRKGDGLVYMKVGTHAQEPLDKIVGRKTREIEEAGYALWGYGGGTCHPLTMVQPFARSYVKRSGVIYLCMQPMLSRHFAEQVRARHFSADGTTWKEIPPTINCIGSRYALVITDLRQEDFELDLSHTSVAIGNSMGLPGQDYVKGRVDKACLEVTRIGGEAPEDGPSIHIGLTAKIVEPYAVFVRE